MNSEFFLLMYDKTHHLILEKGEYYTFENLMRSRNGQSTSDYLADALETVPSYPKAVLMHTAGA